MARHSLKLADYDDRDLIHVLDDLAMLDEDGWVTNTDLATRLNIKTKYPKRSISSRLTALRLMGLLERRTKRGESNWRLTDLAQSMLDSRLKAQGQRMVADAEAGTLWHISDLLGARATAMGHNEGRLVRRQINHYYLAKRERERSKELALAAR